MGLGGGADGGVQSFGFWVFDVVALTGRIKDRCTTHALTKKTPQRNLAKLHAKRRIIRAPTSESFCDVTFYGLI